MQDQPSRTTLKPHAISRVSAGLALVISLVFLTAVQAITLQIPTRPTAFPLVADQYQDVGSIVAWGNPDLGLIPIPQGLTNIIHIDACSSHIIAIKSDTTLSVWGNGQNQNALLTGLTNVAQISGNNSLIVALKSDGSIVVWSNIVGFPNFPTTLTNVVQVAAGTTHAIALKADGTIATWGFSDYGQTNVPRGLGSIVQVSAGNGYSVALRSNGTVVAWGNNNSRQTNVPVGLSNVVQIASAYGYTVALKSDGTVVAWGDNSYGQINVPAGLTNIVQIAVGDTHTVALKSDGTVVAWGDNSYGQINVPTGLTNALQVDAGWGFTAVLKEFMTQSIESISPIADQYFGETLSILTPISSSGLPVSLSIKSGPATISGNIITPTGTGTIVLAANQAGNINWNAAPEVTTSFIVNKGFQTLAVFPQIPSKPSGKDFSITTPDSSTRLPVLLSIKSGPATISGNTITPTGTGTVVLAANQPGDSNWNPASEVTTSFVVRSKGQTIAPFTPIADKFYTTVPFAVAVPASSSKLPVTLTVKSGPATITNGKVTLTGVGEVVLAANQSGNESYAAADEVTTSFTVYPANQTITLPKTYKLPTQAGTYPLPTLYSSAGLPLSFSVSYGPAFIENRNLIVTGPGKVWIQAGQPGDANHNAASVIEFAFNVGKSSQTILTNGIQWPSVLGTYALPSIRTYGGSSGEVIVADIYSSAGLPVEVSLISGPVIDAGYPNYTITRPGTITVLLRQSGNENFKPAPDVRLSFVVKLYDQSLYPFRTVYDQTYGVAPFTVAAPLSSSGLPVTLSVKSGPAAFVKGKLMITGAGTVTLAANQPGNASYNATPEATTSFTVFKADQSITPFGPISDVSFAKTKTLTITPPSATSKLPVSLSVVSGPATISGNRLTLTGRGNVSLAADQPGNANYNPALTVSKTFTAY